MHQITIPLKISKQIVIDITSKRLIYNRNYAMDVVSDPFGYPSPLVLPLPDMGPHSSKTLPRSWCLGPGLPHMGPHSTGPLPRPWPTPTCSNLFIMYYVQLASRRFASYWNVYFLIEDVQANLQTCWCLLLSLLNWFWKSEESSLIASRTNL